MIKEYDDYGFHKKHLAYALSSFLFSFPSNFIFVGLEYLHKGCNLPIIHRDVKASNILLGPNFQAKIADFGLSKTYMSDTQSHISTTAAGTAGYIDIEYVSLCLYYFILVRLSHIAHIGMRLNHK